CARDRGHYYGSSRAWFAYW
nr:immunoglobulin heavy chain junction region [Mus musculus]